MKSIAFNERVYDLPYVAPYAYIDLRSQAARMDEIPELKLEPRLKPFVSILNESAFMTHGCAIASRRPGIPGGASIRVPFGAHSAPHWYSSYVIFSFWHLSQNTQDRYQAIYDSYPSDRNQYNIAFEVEPAYFCSRYEQFHEAKWTDTNGTVCTIWVSGWGNSIQEAQHRWSTGINDVTAFFTEPPATLQELSTPSGITLSQHMFGRVPK